MKNQGICLESEDEIIYYALHLAIIFIQIKNFKQELKEIQTKLTQKIRKHQEV